MHPQTAFMRERYPELAKRYDGVVERITRLHKRGYSLGGRSLADETPAGVAVYCASTAKTMLCFFWEFDTSNSQREQKLANALEKVEEGEAELA